MKTLRREKGTGSVFKRNKHFIYQFTDIDGKVKSITLRKKDGTFATQKSEADQIATELYADYSRMQQLTTQAEYLSKIAEVKKIVIVRNFVKRPYSF